jgi:hypothetical protein
VPPGSSKPLAGSLAFSLYDREMLRELQAAGRNPERHGDAPLEKE